MENRQTLENKPYGEWGTENVPDDHKVFMAAQSPAAIEHAYEIAKQLIPDGYRVFMPYGGFEFSKGSNFFWVVMPAKQKGLRWAEVGQMMDNQAKLLTGQPYARKTDYFTKEVTRLVEDVSGETVETGREMLRNDLLRPVNQRRHWMFWTPKGWKHLSELIHEPIQ